MRFVIALLCLVSVPAFARGSDDFPGGVAFDLGLGYGRAQITNPDSTKAYYKTLALNGRAHIPVYEDHAFGFDLLGGLRYLDLENTANTGTQKEVGNLIGPGVGAQIRVLKFVAGAEYHYILR